MLRCLLIRFLIRATFSVIFHGSQAPVFDSSIYFKKNLPLDVLQMLELQKLRVLGDVCSCTSLRSVAISPIHKGQCFATLRKWKERVVPQCEKVCFVF